MKKILCTLTVVGLAASAFAQGTLQFGANNASTTIRMKNQGEPDTAAVVVPANGGFVQLLWAPAGTAFSDWNLNPGSLTAWLAANPGWQVAGDPKAIGPAAGRFTATTYTLATATPGAVVDAAVIGWTGGNTFDAAVAANGSLGFSPKFSVDTGNPNAQPVAEFPGLITGTGQFGGLIVAPVVPEPSSMALVGLGAAALLALRRRK